jgi:hypothetical protein
MRDYFILLLGLIVLFRFYKALGKDHLELCLAWFIVIILLMQYFS